MSPGSGYVEVWLINQDGKRMVSLGILSSDQATFPVPPDAISQGYTIVDLSHEQFDDKPAAQRRQHHARNPAGLTTARSGGFCALIRAVTLRSTARGRGPAGQSVSRLGVASRSARSTLASIPSGVSRIS